MRYSFVLVLNLILVIFLSGSGANAAQLGKIIVDKADVHEFPQQESKTIFSLGKDEMIAVSNLPTEGFYKVRLKSGELGWLSGNDVLVTPPDESAKVGKFKEQAKKSDHDKKELKFKEDEQEEALSHGFQRPRSRVILAMGLQNPVYDGIGTYFITTGINPGYGAHVEFQFHWFSSVYWALRGEYTFTKTASVDLGNGLSQTMKHTGVPLQVGAVWSPIENKTLRLGFGAYGGLSVMNSTTVTQTDSTEVLTATYGSTDPCFTFAVQGGYALGKNASVFFEAGYRYEKSGELMETALISPAYIPAFKIDYSGPIGRFGLEFRF